MAQDLGPKEPADIINMNVATWREEHERRIAAKKARVDAARIKDVLENQAKGVPVSLGPGDIAAVPRPTEERPSLDAAEESAS